MLLAIVATVLGCGASDEPTKPADAPRTEPPVAVCEATHAADGPTCVPGFDECGEHEVARLGGGCEAVGVPVSACAKGFVHDGKGGCSATLPRAACAEGSIALPGMTACEPLLDCGTGTFGAIADSSSTLHVDGAYVGGASDGSRGKPFTRIADAMARAADGSIVAVAAGTYEEDVVLAKSIQLIGRCPSLVTIKGVSAGERDGAVLMTAGAKVRGVSITGPASGLIIDAAANAIVESVRVHGSSITTGIWIRKGATAASLDRVLVDNVKNYGILVSGSSARIVGAHVHDVREDVSAAALRVNPDPISYAPAEATVLGSLIEKNDYTNVQTVSAKLTIEGSVIRDGVPTLGEWGVGAMVTHFAASKIVGELTVRKSVVEGNTYMGLLARDGRLIVEDTVVRDTAIEPKEKIYGRGIVAQGASGKRTQLTVKNSLVERNQETGIDVNGDAVARVETTIVRETRANGGTGTGIFGEVLSKNAPELSIDRCLLRDNPHAGVIASGAATITGSRFEGNGIFSIAARGGQVSLLRSLVHDSRPSQTGLDGQGLYAFFDTARRLAPAITIEDSAIVKSVKAAVVVIGGALTVRRSVVRDVAVEAPTGASGFGIAVERDHPDLPATCDISGTLVEGTQGAAIAAIGVEAKLSGVHVRNVAAHKDGQFGDGVLAFGMVFSNGVVSAASVSLEGSIIEKSARAGVALFGSTLSVSGSFLTCNGIAINVEPVAGWNGTEWIAGEFSLRDLGGNVCGCDASAKCASQSANLRPIVPSSSRPEL